MPKRCGFESNQLDALGVCGGNCENDLDTDGICDNIDDCVGEYDECGVCNGPGAIYSCGCYEMPEADCDCDGNQLDALVLQGDCESDLDQNGTCDDSEILGCMDTEACNYLPTATQEDGSCDYCSCEVDYSHYALVVDSTPALCAKPSVFKIYVSFKIVMTFSQRFTAQTTQSKIYL